MPLPSSNQASMLSHATEWTEPEKWVWEQVSKGEVADFNLKFKSDLDPQKPVGWTDERLVSAKFLQTILLHSLDQNEQPRRGIRISGAWIKDLLDLSNAHLKVEWWLDKSRIQNKVDISFIRTTELISFESSVFEQDVDISSGIFDRQLNLNGAKVAGKVDMDSVSIKSSLSMANNASFREVNLPGAKIDGDLDLSGTKVTGPLNMNLISVGSNLFMRTGAEFGSIDMIGAKISAGLDMGGSKFTGNLLMDSVSIDGHLFMGDNAGFKEVGLTSAKISGQIDMSSARFTGDLQMDSISIGGHLFMRGHAEFKEVSLTSAKVGGQLEISGAKFTGSLQMDSISIGSHLLMRDNTEFIKKDDTSVIEMTAISAKVGGQLEINGTRIDGSVKMDSILVGSNFYMSNGAELKEASLIGAKIDGQFEINSIRVTKNLIMDSIFIAGALLIDKAVLDEVSLASATIGSNFEMTDTDVDKKLDMNSISIGSNLFIRSNTYLGNADMIGAKVGAQLEIQRSSIPGALAMDSISVGSHLLIGEGSEFKDLILIVAKIGGDLDIKESKFAGTLNMESIFVDKTVFLSAEKFEKEVCLIDANISGSLVVSGAEISSLDLSGTHIRGKLQIGSSKVNPVWLGKSALYLRNTQIGTLEDRNENSWPAELDMDGFTYSRLSGVANQENTHGDTQITDRPAKWFINWLNRDKTYSPQPYHQLAGVLTAMGYSEKANEVLHASKNRERNLAFDQKHWWKWIGLSFLQSTIGYGYGARYFRSLLWVLGLIISGVIVLYSLPPGQIPYICSFGNRLGFSLDMLLPIVELDERYKLTFEGWQLYYFYFHKLMGFLLGSFVVAGLSGITKK